MSLFGQPGHPRTASPMADQRRSRRPNLRDVAARAGVDVSTVSRVLSGDRSQRASAATRDKIVQAAEALDYRPNALARALRTARTSTIGIVVPQLDNPVFSSAILGAEEAASARGYSLLITHRDPKNPAEGEFQRLAATHRVDGLLVSSLDEDRNLIASLEATGIPFVLMNRRLGSAAAVALDSEEAARMGTDHLLALGHRRIAHLAGRLEGFNGRARLKGYEAALAARGIAPDPTLVEAAGYTAEGGAEATRRLLARSGPRPTAILAATLVSATGALATLHAAGIAVPAAMSVVAIHDNPLAAMVYPALTTVRTPIEEMGRKAAEMLIALLDGRAPPSQTLLPPAGLISRASAAPPPD